MDKLDIDFMIPILDFYIKNESHLPFKMVYPNTKLANQVYEYLMEHGIKVVISDKTIFTI